MAARRGIVGRARLQDVAARAGVSVVTVSRAMNKPATVSARTHERIREAMRALDYVPDLGARGMAKRRSGLVAAFMPTLTDPIFADTVRGLEEVLAPEGRHLLLGVTDYDLGKEEELVAAALGRRPDALVLTGATHTDRLRRLVERAAVPCVETWSLPDRPLDRAVGFDHAEAARALTRHLLGRGRRRIGFVGRPGENNERAAGKRRGHCGAMAEAGLEVEGGWVWQTETSMAKGREAVDRLVVGQRLDAVVFSGDSVAAGAWLACLERGIRVPDDVAICGFGDHEIARTIPGGLTTVRVDAHAIGRAAGHALIDAESGSTGLRSAKDIGFQFGEF